MSNLLDSRRERTQLMNTKVLEGWGEEEADMAMAGPRRSPAEPGVREIRTTRELATRNSTYAGELWVRPRPLRTRLVPRARVQVRCSAFAAPRRNRGNFGRRFWLQCAGGYRRLHLRRRRGVFLRRQLPQYGGAHGLAARPRRRPPRASRGPHCRLSQSLCRRRPTGPLARLAR